MYNVYTIVYAVQPLAIELTTQHIKRVGEHSLNLAVHHMQTLTHNSDQACQQCGYASPPRAETTQAPQLNTWDLTHTYA